MTKKNIFERAADLMETGKCSRKQFLEMAVAGGGAMLVPGFISNAFAGDYLKGLESFLGKEVSDKLRNWIDQYEGDFSRQLKMEYFPDFNQLDARKIRTNEKIYSEKFELPEDMKLEVLLGKYLLAYRKDGELFTVCGTTKSKTAKRSKCVLINPKISRDERIKHPTFEWQAIRPTPEKDRKRLTKFFASKGIKPKKRDIETPSMGQIGYAKVGDILSKILGKGEKCNYRTAFGK